MTVLHLLGSPAEGGAETYFLDLVRALAADGPTAAAVRHETGREAALRAEGIETRTFPFAGTLDWVSKRRIGAYAEQLGARTLVAWMNRAARHTPKGRWARIGRLGGYYAVKNYKGFDALVANTEHIRLWLTEQGWPAERIRYIPNFAEAADATPLPRSELDTPEGAPLLLGMGRLHTSKAHDVSLQALADVHEAYLWIAGAGPEEGRLKRRAEELGVAERVRWLGWRDDPGRLYRAADVCLFPSRFEPLGNVVIQSWAYGVPIVAAASQGPGALIRDREDGLLVPIDDPAALADETLRLLRKPELRAKLAANGRARAAAEFSKAAVVAQWRALFAEYGAA